MKINSLIDKYNIISFDIFDTLIKRYVNKPEDIFYFVENIYDKKNKIKSNFKIKRINAEKRARKKYPYTEVNLDEIYGELIRDFSLNECHFLKNLEIEAEVDFCFRNKEIYDIYKYAVLKKKKIYIISDMYLPREIIEKILKKNGYCDYEKIYLSHEKHITKSSGELFNYFLEKESILANEVLHIGDNKHSDVKMAKKQGLNAYYYRESIRLDKHLRLNKLNINEKINCNVINRFLMYNDKMQDLKGYKVGYNLCGPLLFGYSKWLLENVKTRGIRKILFLSRDGYILKKCLSIINEDVIETEYVYVSRKSVVGARLEECCTLKDIMEKYKAWPRFFYFKYFLDRIGFSVNIFGKEKDNSIFSRIFTKEKFMIDKKINDYFEQIIYTMQKQSKKQKAYLYDYLKKYIGEKNLAIVDIGGNLTIQKNLQDFFYINKMDINVISFNLLLKIEEQKSAKAFLYAKDKNRYLENLIEPFYYFLEILLTAPHGSVIGYKNNENKVVPIFGEYDYENNGKFLEEKYIIENMQNGALDFINDIKFLGMKYLDITPNIAINNFINFGISPTIKEAEKWGEFRFNADGLSKLIIIKSLKHYIFNLKDLIHDFKISMWKGGFLTRLLGTSKYNKFIIFMLNLLKSIYKHKKNKY